MALPLKNQADFIRKDDAIGVSYTYKTMWPPEQGLVLQAFPDSYFLWQLVTFNHYKTKEIPQGTYICRGSAKLDSRLREDNALAWLKLFSFQIYAGIFEKKKKKLELIKKSKILFLKRKA